MRFAGSVWTTAFDEVLILTYFSQEYWRGTDVYRSVKSLKPSQMMRDSNVKYEKSVQGERMAEETAKSCPQLWGARMFLQHTAVYVVQP